jgi:hypothetical protein
MSARVDRVALVRTGIQLEVFTVLWMTVEAAISIGAGVLAGSVLLIAFGLDSVVEPCAVMRPMRSPVATWQQPCCLE